MAGKEKGQVRGDRFHRAVNGNPAQREAGPEPDKTKRRGRGVNSRVATGVLVGLLSLYPSLPGQQASTQGNADSSAKAIRVSADIAQQRHDVLQTIWTESAILVENRRWACMTGKEPEFVKEARSDGLDFTPDASKMCVTTLERQSQEGKALWLYQRFAKDAGSAMTPEQVLQAVESAARNNQPTTQAIGPRGAIAITPAKALDAGYTRAVRDKTTLSSLGIAETPENVGKLLGIAESCLDGRNNKAPSPSTCYVTGLALAAKDAALKSQ